MTYELYSVLRVFLICVALLTCGILLTSRCLMLFDKHEGIPVNDPPVERSDEVEEIDTINQFQVINQTLQMNRRILK